MADDPMQKLIGEFEARARIIELWPWCSRATFGKQLRKRLRQPRINQGHGTYLCGTASVVQQLLLTSLRDFVQFAVDLYENGHGSIRIGGAESNIAVIKTDPALRQVDPHHYGGPVFAGDCVDWIVLASVRHNMSTKSNWRPTFLYPQYEAITSEAAKNFIHAGAMPAEVANMFRSLGFSVIREDCSSLFTKGLGNLQMADEALRGGFHVNLYVDSFITRKYGIKNPAAVKQVKHFSMTATHWIVVSSNKIAIDQAKKTIQFSFIDYGTEKAKIEFPMAEFLSHYYGYLAAAQ